jgi:transcriptional regulator with XRE-family HTH domain
MKRITIKDIAKMLNISTSTVSRALKNHPDISASVKQRVKEAADTFNYVPNDFAINFRKKSSKVIGLIIPEISMFFIPSIIKGISFVLHSEGYNFCAFFRRIFGNGRGKSAYLHQLKGRWHPDFSQQTDEGPQSFQQN